MSNEKIVPKTLSGMMELLPKEQLKFEQIKSTLEEVYRLYGFLPLDTPVLEASSVLLAKAGGETEKQIYRFAKGDNDMTMRFDLTVPLAKYVAKNAGELSFPFRRYQIGKVYRGERAQKGRFREFYQADIDIIGDGKLSVLNDAEIPSMIYDIFTRLGLDDFTIRINNRKILNGFYEILSLSDKSQDIMRTVDKIEKIGKEKVIAELQLLEIEKEDCEKITDFIASTSNNSEAFDKLDMYLGKNEQYDLGVSELKTVIESIAMFGVPEKNYRVDLSIARGLDYYTGTVYETTFNRHPEIGSICSGGRYDELASFYTDRHLPGVGISIGLTRLFYILSEMNYIDEAYVAPCDVMILPMIEDTSYIIGLSAKLRRMGIKTQISTEGGKMKSRLNYANRLGIPFVIFVGEDEIASGNITLKNMESGAQAQFEVDKAAEQIITYVNGKKAAKIINLK
ncbi:MAG: histidine--tRNA ligase [Ruminococcaceae bacterium]|nr:histidine--tRNA ligase [Oscillospiraceae bacterium]